MGLAATIQKHGEFGESYATSELLGRILAAEEGAGEVTSAVGERGFAPFLTHSVSSCLCKMARSGSVVRTGDRLRPWMLVRPATPLLERGYERRRFVLGGRRNRPPERYVTRRRRLRDHVLATLWRLSQDCAVCGMDLFDPIHAEVDHIRPVSKHGEYERCNLCLCHVRCNGRKGEHEIDEARGRVRAAVAAGAFDLERALRAELLYRTAEFDLPTSWRSTGGDPAEIGT